jgi:hypothetical protein
MKIEEAIEKLNDSTFDGNYSSLMMDSSILNKTIGKYKNSDSFYICTCDWPQMYSLRKEDYNAEDWRIVRSTTD